MGCLQHLHGRRTGKKTPQLIRGNFLSQRHLRVTSNKSQVALEKHKTYLPAVYEPPD